MRNVAEAPSCWTSACIATACGIGAGAAIAGAAGALVREGENGFVMDPADASAFARHMQTLLNPDLRQRLAAASRQIGEQMSAHRRGAALWEWMEANFIKPEASASR